MDLPAGRADALAQHEAIGIDHRLAAKLETRLTQRRTFKRSAYAPRRAFTVHLASSGYVVVEDTYLFGGGGGVVMTILQLSPYPNSNRTF